MDLGRVVEAYEAVEATTKRLEMTSILAELFADAPPGDLAKVVYLTQGQIAPGWAGLEPGLADKLIVEAIALATGLSEDDVDRLRIEAGDLGSAAARAVRDKRQTALFTDDLTVASVHDTLVEMARAEGAGSQDKKKKLLAKLLHDADPGQARAVVRVIVGKMRLGIGDMTILDGLAEAFTDDGDRGPIERAYNVCSDLGEVAETLARDGVEALEGFGVRVGRPVRPMLAERSSGAGEILEKMPEGCAAEYKYDGLRLQVHVGEDGDVELFSRRLEPSTEAFPDVVEAVRDAVQAGSAILEGECVAVDPQTGSMRPFQYISHRRGRKHDLDEVVEAYPVRLYLFDCLYRDGRDLTREAFPDRREALEQAVLESGDVVLSRIEPVGDADQLDRFFEAAIDAGAEGVMVKSTAADSIYRAGARGWLWVKYKRDYRTELVDTVDLVAVGALAGQGQRAGVYGALLMAAFDPADDVFRTVCRLSTGFSDETLAAMPDLFEDLVLDDPHPRVETEMEVDFWFAPEKVLELHGSDLTLSPVHTAARGRIEEGAGVSIRFPRFMRFRDDKGPKDATTVDELVELYRRQVKVDVEEE